MNAVPVPQARGESSQGELPRYEAATGRMRRERLRLGANLARLAISIANPYLPRPRSQCIVLDCGCGYGQTTLGLARLCAHVVGCDPCASMVEEARRLQRAAGVANADFLVCSADQVPDRDRYDLVLLDNVLEHIPNQEESLRALRRALRSDGVLLIIVPNRLWPIEVHYRLPFLSYLPLPLANAYLRLTGRGYDYSDASYAPTYWRLERLLQTTGFRRWEYVIPGESTLQCTMAGGPWHYRIGARLLKRFPMLWAIAKAFVVVAWK